MIRHIVLIRVRAGVTDAAMQAIFDDLGKIRDVVPGTGEIVAGRSKSPERIERGYMHGYTVDFADWDALAAYQAHPDHKSIGARLVAAAEGGIDGILVFDVEA